MEDDPADEEDDFEVDLEAVDVVSFALVVVSLGCNSLFSDSILMATAPVLRWCCFLILDPSLPRSRGGLCRVQITNQHADATN